MSEASPSKIDIYRAAKLLIDQDGNTASIEAAMRADAMLDKGDLDGKAVWMQVLEAVKELQSTVPSGAVH